MGPMSRVRYREYCTRHRLIGSVSMASEMSRQIARRRASELTHGHSERLTPPVVDVHARGSYDAACHRMITM